MQAIEIWGADLLVDVQSALLPVPGLEFVMKLFSHMGAESFYMVVVPFLYWCVHPTIGLRLFLMLLVSSYSNALLKWAFHGPRPFWINTEVQGLYPEQSYGVPSGHSQNALSVWVYLSSLLDRFAGARWFWHVGFLLAFFISISRMVLGVHFPHDVLFGWAFGFLLLLLFWRYADRVGGVWDGLSFGARVALSLGVSGALIAVGVIAHLAASGLPVPQEWLLNSAEANGPDHPIAPHKLDVVVTTATLVGGIGVGEALRARFVPEFSVSGPWWQRILRYVVGLSVLFGLTVALGKLFPREPEVTHQAFRFIRYFIIALWAAFGAQWVFVKLGLSGRD